MKKLIIVSLVMIMLAFSVVPAFAAGGPPAERGKANGTGTVLVRSTVCIIGISA
jgi:hypothetical protein